MDQLSTNEKRKEAKDTTERVTIKQKKPEKFEMRQEAILVIEELEEEEDDYHGEGESEIFPYLSPIEKKNKRALASKQEQFSTNVKKARREVGRLKRDQLKELE